MNHPACKTSARTEELDRYWGFENGLMHYVTLPWRQVMNADAYGYYVTLAPMLLLFPLLLLLPFFWSRQGRWLRMITDLALPAANPKVMNLYSRQQMLYQQRTGTK